MLEMLAYIYSIVIISALVLIWDAKKRGWSFLKSVAAAFIVFMPLIVFPYYGFLWAYFLIPLYIALRPPKVNEIKIGGWQWHFGKNLAVSIGVLYFVMLGIFFALRSKVIEFPFLLDGYDPSILQLSGFIRITILPLLAILIAYSAGRFLKDDLIVQRGTLVFRLDTLAKLVVVPPAEHNEPVIYRNGKYWIAGHNISLSSIIDAWSEGRVTPEEIAENHFSTLTAQEIESALNYYSENKNEIDQAILKEYFETEKAAATAHQNPSPVRARIDRLLKEKISTL